MFTKESKDNKPQRATEDIVVFKYMTENRNGTFSSKHTRTVYEPNKVYSLRNTLFLKKPYYCKLSIKEFLYALLFNRFVGIRKDNMNVRYAFHSYISRDIMIEIKCIIPKGALYMKNTHWNEIISNKIKVIGRAKCSD